MHSEILVLKCPQCIGGHFLLNLFLTVEVIPKPEFGYLRQEDDHRYFPISAGSGVVDLFQCRL